MLNIHKDLQSPRICKSFCWSYKMQSCTKRFPDSPGAHTLRITAFKMEPALQRHTTPRREANCPNWQGRLIRAHGRLENARILPRGMRNLIVLPRDHQLAILSLHHLHLKWGHCSYKSLMHEARQKFWIIWLRKMHKAVLSECVVCWKLHRKPLDQLMGQIPSLRVTAGFPPFSNTAIDMFGPLQIWLNQRTLEETQVVIFTCTTTRAIHLELVTNKTTEAFLIVFGRFAWLRGHPNICSSHCGSNFLGA